MSHLIFQRDLLFLKYVFYYIIPTLPLQSFFSSSLLSPSLLISPLVSSSLLSPFCPFPFSSILFSPVVYPALLISSFLVSSLPFLTFLFSSFQSISRDQIGYLISVRENFRLISMNYLLFFTVPYYTVQLSYSHRLKLSQLLSLALITSFFASLISPSFLSRSHISPFFFSPRLLHQPSFCLSPSPSLPPILIVRILQSFLLYLSSSQGWDNSPEFFRYTLLAYQKYVKTKNQNNLPALITGKTKELEKIIPMIITYIPYYDSIFFSNSN